MIRVVLLDFDGTLVDEALQPFPGVPAALAALAQMRTADGEPLVMGLVSDWTLATPPLPATAARIKTLVQEFLERLDRSGLTAQFEPVATRVTLSTHAGEHLPARAVFAAALKRLKSSATLDDCLFITSSAGHAAASAPQAPLRVVRFGRTLVAPAGFASWVQAPALVADALGRSHAHASANLLLAAQAQLAPGRVEIQSLDESGSDHFTTTGSMVRPVTMPAASGLGTIDVNVPVRVQLTRDHAGALDAQVTEPSAEDLAEAANFAASLAKHGDIGDGPTSTHALETDADGQRRLVRRGYRAF